MEINSKLTLNRPTLNRPKSSEKFGIDSEFVDIDNPV